MAVNWNMADELTALMAHRAKNESKQKIQEFTVLFGGLIEKVIAAENKVAAIKSKENSASATIKFTAREIDQMGADFQKEIKLSGNVARVIKTTPNGEIRYEIRYCRNGYHLSVFSSNLIEAKGKFIQETNIQNKKIGA